MSAEPAIHGMSLWGEPLEAPPAANKLSEQFLVPPFSVLSAREGWWQERKRAWLSCGLRGELGRAGGCGGSVMPAANYSNNARGNGAGRELTDGDENATSIFDPVICELVYRWFCPNGGQVVDPFAGGSVRGIVAAMLGRNYWGCDLRAEQIEANQFQAVAICKERQPQWVCGDSRETLPSAPLADLIFSCPPYGNLEKYSNDPRDLSAMSHEGFLAAYGQIITAACERLKPDRFACFVVGDFRDNRGHYRDFPSETIRAFKVAGLEYYNEAILVTAVGSLPIRITKQFTSGRKLGKTHQNILVFVKGDWRKATAACGELIA